MQLRASQTSYPHAITRQPYTLFRAAIMMLRHGLRSALLGQSKQTSRLLFPASASSAARAMGTVTYSPPAVKIGKPAPTFKAVSRRDESCGLMDGMVIVKLTCPRRNHPSQGAVVDGEIKQVSLEDYKGSWTVVFFYPKDFT